MVDIHCDICGRETPEPVEVQRRRTRGIVHITSAREMVLPMEPTLRLCPSCAYELDKAICGLASAIRGEHKKQVDE